MHVKWDLDKYLSKNYRQKKEKEKENFTNHGKTRHGFENPWGGNQSMVFINMFLNPFIHQYINSWKNKTWFPNLRKEINWWYYEIYKIKEKQDIDFKTRHDFK